MTPPTFTELELVAFSLPARTAYRLAHPDRYWAWKLEQGVKRIKAWEAKPGNKKRKMRRQASRRKAEQALKPLRTCACGCHSNIPKEAKHNRLWAFEACRVILEKQWAERHAGERALSNVLDTAVRQGKFPTAVNIKSVVPTCFTCETNPPLPGKNVCFDCLRDFLKEKNS